MHRIFVVVALFGLLPAVAGAADLPVKAPPLQTANVLWNGWYVGIEGGWAQAKAAQTNVLSTVSDGDYDQHGMLVGGTFGFNRQFGQWIVGLESDLSWAHIFGEETICGRTHNQVCPTETRGLGTVRGRLGFAVLGNSMIYATGGWATADVRAYKEGVAATGGEDWKSGWTVGGGFETMFMPHWSFKAEYLFVQTPGTATTYVIAASNTPISAVEHDMHVIRGGINWHF